MLFAHSKYNEEATTRRPVSQSPDVHICETGPRDGLQNLAVFVPTAAKFALIDAIAAAGVAEIDAGSFVPAKVVPQFADVEQVMAHALKLRGVTVGALVPNLKGAERALAAGVQAIYFVISASETHNKANVRRTVAEQIEGFKAVRAGIDAGPAAGRPHLMGAVSTAFGCSLEGRISGAAVCRVARAYAEAGADEIGLADTVGYATPPLIKSIVEAVRAEVGREMPLRLHLHDTLGMGLANAVAGLEVDIRRFDAAVSGLGGCPFAPGARGNIVTEDLVFMLEEMGLSTGIDLPKLMETRAILRQHVPAEHLTGHLHEAGIPAALWRAA
ncbi:MAG: hydroxymethylglutaryl-CoA lyase [Hyphomicrobiaceae bacterium]|nr:hydroxymethylglutaryl-CoA lyase [Hyphomicrobiaceae bacterium]